MASKKWLDTATPSQNAVLDRAFKVFPSQRAGVRIDTEEKITGLREGGAFVYDLTDDQRARWIEAAHDVHPAILRDIGGDAEAIYGRVLAATAEFKARSEQN
jgi:hypothetical protein